MKKIRKKIVFFLTLALGCLIPLNCRTLVAHAEEPTTYYLKDVDGKCRFQIGGWDDSSTGRDVYYMQDGDQKIKDGDVIVTVGDVQETFNVYLSNLTFAAGYSLITVNGVDECFVQGNSTGVVNGDVVNAHVYAGSTGQFNGNVGNLFVASEGDGRDTLKANIAVTGTVDYVNLYAITNKGIFNEFYDIPANKFYMTNGSLPPDNEYPTEPTGSGRKVSSGRPSASYEYDDVPKTGDPASALWLLGAAAACGFAGYGLKRKQA